MHRIILLRKKTGEDTVTISESVYGNSVLVTDSFNESLQYLTENKADILLVSRDSPGIRPEDMHRIRDRGFRPVCIIWPPEKDLQSIISSFTSSDTDREGEEPEGDHEPESDLLMRKNQELVGRISALESVVRSLLTALSHYDLSYEAYTGEDAWQLIMQGLPAADQIPDDLTEDEEPDEDKEIIDRTNGN